MEGLLGCVVALHMICGALRRTVYSNTVKEGLLGWVMALHMICGALLRTFYSNTVEGLLGCLVALHICGALRRTVYSNTVEGLLGMRIGFTHIQSATSNDLQ